MTTRMLQRRGLASEWAATNPVLGDGEIGFIKDTGEIRIGDGVTPFEDIVSPYSTELELSSKVSKSGDVMTGALEIHVNEDADAIRIFSTTGSMKKFYIRAGYTGGIEFVNDAYSAIVALITDTGSASFSSVYDSGQRVYSLSNPDATRVAKTGDAMSGRYVLNGQGLNNQNYQSMFEIQGDTNSYPRITLHQPGIDAKQIRFNGSTEYVEVVNVNGDAFDKLAASVFLASGNVAEIKFSNQDNNGFYWSWYSYGNVSRLWSSTKGGDTITVGPDGTLTAYGQIVAWNPSNGSIRLSPGDVNHTGYIEFWDNIDRKAYIGYAANISGHDTGNLQYYAGQHTFAGLISAPDISIPSSIATVTGPTIPQISWTNNTTDGFVLHGIVVGHYGLTGFAYNDGNGSAGTNISLSAYFGLSFSTHGFERVRINWGGDTHIYAPSHLHGSSSGFVIHGRDNDAQTFETYVTGNVWRIYSNVRGSDVINIDSNGILNVWGSASYGNDVAVFGVGGAGAPTIRITDNVRSSWFGLITGSNDYVSGTAPGDSFIKSTSGRLFVSGAITATGLISGIANAPSGLTGATAASRYVGATTSGAPVSGTFAKGDFVIDQTAKIWICTVAGTPGTWVQSGGSGSSSGATIKAVYTDNYNGGASTTLSGSSNGFTTSFNWTQISNSVTIVCGASGVIAVKASTQLVSSTTTNGILACVVPAQSTSDAVAACNGGSALEGGTGWVYTTGISGYPLSVSSTRVYTGLTPGTSYTFANYGCAGANSLISYKGIASAPASGAPCFSNIVATTY